MLVTSNRIFLKNRAQCKAVKSHGFLFMLSVYHLKNYITRIFLFPSVFFPLYNETLRGCFTVGEKKKIEKVEISIVYTDGRMARCCDKMEIIINPELFIETMWLSATFTVLP